MKIRYFSLLIMSLTIPIYAMEGSSQEDGGTDEESNPVQLFDTSWLREKALTMVPEAVTDAENVVQSVVTKYVDHNDKYATYPHLTNLLQKPNVPASYDTANNQHSIHGDINALIKDAMAEIWTTEKANLSKQVKTHKTQKYIFAGISLIASIIAIASPSTIAAICQGLGD